MTRPEKAEPPAAGKTPTLSKRAIELSKGAPPLIEAVFSRIFGKQYSPEHPDGVLNLGIAENSLMADWFLDQYKTLPLERTDLTYGDSLSGSTRLCTALSKLFAKYFNPLTPVLAEHMICGVGVSACLDQLCGKICDEGDTIMMSVPYYNGFDGDFGARNGVTIVGVNVGDVEQSSPATLDAFERTMIEMTKEGKKLPRAVLLCNPHNPLGHIYPRETVLEYCRFAERHNLHLIVDEIYALSLFENPDVKDKVPFESILSIDVYKEAQCNPARVHMVYGMSKDFGSNGLRVGVLVSQHNKPLIKSFSMSAILMKLSSPSDALWSKLLQDEELLSNYIVKAQRQAGEAIRHVVGWLDALDIPHSNPAAGHFIWIDLRAYLPRTGEKGTKLETVQDQEWELCRRLLWDQNVYVAPGAIYHAPTPGFFRLTFTIRREYMDEGLDRVRKTLLRLKKENVE